VRGSVSTMLIHEGRPALLIGHRHPGLPARRSAQPPTTTWRPPHTALNPGGLLAVRVNATATGLVFKPSRGQGVKR
jgi:hypothetical protein